MLKRILLIGGGIFALLIGVILFRTFSYGGEPAGVREITLPEAPGIDGTLAAEHLGAAIRFKTISYVAGGPSPEEAGPWLDLQAWMETTYPAFHAAANKETIPGGYSLLFTWTGSDSSLNPILLMAHQDVVPVNEGTESDWEAPAFAGEIKNGYVYGRGAIDDKSSMVSQFEALDALAKTGFRPKRTILFMLGHDEEVSGSGAEAGIALLKSRGVKPEMALDEGYMVIDPSPLTGKAMAFIGIAEKGYLTLDITITATGGHSSTPPRDSGTVRLARALIAIDENQMPSHLSEAPAADLFALTAGDMPFMQRMAFANQWLFGGMIDKSMAGIPVANAMIRTTTAPTMLTASAKENVLAQRATAMVNFRIHPADTVEDVIAHVKDVTKGIEGISVTASGDGIEGTPASPVSAVDNLAYGVLSAVAADISDGAPVAPALVLGATDSRYAAAITDSVYRFVPAVMSGEELTGFHGTNERIRADNIGRMSTGYAKIILAMDANE